MYLNNKNLKERLVNKMNLKDWILNYLMQEKKSLNSRINQYQAIIMDSQMGEDIRQERLKMMKDFDMQDKNSYRLNLNYNFIKARTARMLDGISGHMPEFYPGSIASKKYGESRAILNQIENEITAYMSMEMVGNGASAKLAKLDGIIALANTLEHKYCCAHDKF